MATAASWLTIPGCDRSAACVSKRWGNAGQSGAARTRQRVYSEPLLFEPQNGNIATRALAPADRHLHGSHDVHAAVHRAFSRQTGLMDANSKGWPWQQSASGPSQFAAASYLGRAQQLVTGRRRF